MFVTIALLLAVGSALVAQQYEGVYYLVRPAPQDQSVRIVVMPREPGYRVIFAVGGELDFDCTSTGADEYECTGEIDSTARIADDGQELVIFIDEFGADASPIRAPLQSSDPSLPADEYHGFVDEDRYFLKAVLTPTSDGMAMRWFLGEIGFDALATESARGVLSGDLEGDRFSVTIDPEQLLFDVDDNVSEWLFARVLPGRADEPIRTTDVGPRFGDHRVAGTMRTAFESWYGTAPPASVDVPARDLTVASRHELDAGERRMSYLSPAGDRLVSYASSSDVITVHDVATGDDLVSFELAEEMSAPQVFAWSPDGSAIAIGIVAPFAGEDMEADLDLHLLSLADGSIRNLTAQEQVSQESIPREERKRDLAPLWVGPEQLAFERRNAEEVVIAELDLATRTVTQAVTPPSAMYPSAGILAFAPMTGELFTTFEVGGWIDEGLRVISPGGRLARMEKEFSYPLLPDLSAVTFDGAHVLLVPPSVGRSEDPEDQPVIYDREADEFRPLLPGEPGARQALGAAFSPDGSKVVYLSRALAAERDVLAVRDLGEPDSEQILIESVPGHPNHSLVAYGDPGMDWAANDTVLVPMDGRRRIMVVTLEASGE